MDWGREIYTDAVVFDFDSKKILASAKALTTKEDLSIGIGNAMDRLDSRYFDQVSLVSLSTTLATNACIEGKGGRAKLVWVWKNAYRWIRKGFRPTPDSGEIYCSI